MMWAITVFGLTIITASFVIFFVKRQSWIRFVSACGVAPKEASALVTTFWPELMVARKNGIHPISACQTLVETAEQVFAELESATPEAQKAAIKQKLIVYFQ